MTIFRLREQHLKSKFQGKQNKFSNKYRAKLQDRLDIFQSMQIIYKIVPLECIPASLTPLL